jgi:hypothetical protein
MNQIGGTDQIPSKTAFEQIQQAGRMLQIKNLLKLKSYMRAFLR